MESTKQHYHMNKWDCLAFLAILYAIYKISIAFGKIVEAYFNSNKTEEIIIEKVK